MPRKKLKRNSNESDPVIEQLLAQLEHHNLELKAKADLVLCFVQYLKRRYRSVNEWRDTLNLYITELESACREASAMATLIERRKFIPISRTISFARKSVPRLTTAFGSALQKRPTGEDLAAIRRLKSPKISDLIDYELELEDIEREIANASPEPGPASIPER